MKKRIAVRKSPARSRAGLRIIKIKVHRKAAARPIQLEARTKSRPKPKASAKASRKPKPKVTLAFQPRRSSAAAHEQPEPFTPGVTKSMVRQHAFALYRDRLPNSALTLEDWVLAEKDLVQDIQTEDGFEP